MSTPRRTKIALLATASIATISLAGCGGPTYSLDAKIENPSECDVKVNDEATLLTLDLPAPRSHRG